MHKTPPKIFKAILRERPPCERKAIFDDHECGGRSTMEHAQIYAGRQVDEKWAIIRICEKAHSVGAYSTQGGILNKEMNRYISFTHATTSDFAKYPKRDWQAEWSYLNKKYGEKHQTTNTTGIDHPTNNI